MDHTHQEEQHRAIMIQNLTKFKTEEEKLLDSGKDDREKTQTGDKSGEKPSKNNTSHMEEMFREIKQFPLQSKKSDHTEQPYPINRDGRKQYDREFLLQLQNAPQSMIKPANLPDIPDNVIKKTATYYSQRMPSPVFQKSMPTTQQELFQMSQQNTINFTHTLNHTYNSPPAVFYNLAAQQQKRPFMIAGMSGQGWQSTKNREHTLLPIIDPASGKDISREIQQAQSPPPLSDILASHSAPSTEPETSMPGSGKENQDLNEEQPYPINRDGRKQYDREFLLQLQNAPQSMIKPANLPDIPDAIIKKKLELTKIGVGPPTNPTTGMHILLIEDSLNILILNKSCSNEEVFSWIKENVDEPTTVCEHFIRALVTAVCRSAIIVSNNSLMNVDKSQIQRRKNLLQKYLDQQAWFELQALYVLQALVHKLQYPPE